MNLHQLNVFAEASLDNSIKLAIVRDLERLYAPLVGEPIPPNLRTCIDRLRRWRSEQLRLTSRRDQLRSPPIKDRAGFLSCASEGGPAGGVASELAKQKPGLTQRRRDHDVETALQYRPGGLERRRCALATLSRGIEQQARRRRQQHIALPGMESKLRDALGPSDRVSGPGGLSWCQAASELRSSASSRLRAAVLMPASPARAPSHRQRPQTARPCEASRSGGPRPGRCRWPA